MRTLPEMMELLSEWLSPDEIVEILGLSTEELVSRLEDIIKDKLDYLNEEFSNDEEEVD